MILGMVCHVLWQACSAYSCVVNAAFGAPFSREQHNIRTALFLRATVAQHTSACACFAIPAASCRRGIQLAAHSALSRLPALA